MSLLWNSFLALFCINYVKPELATILVGLLNMACVNRQASKEIML